jgi:hypothetical protein
MKRLVKDKKGLWKRAANIETDSGQQTYVRR